MEKLVCNVCGREYTDEASIEQAKVMELPWVESCKTGGIEVTGIAPCPDIDCKGQLVLKTICADCVAELTEILGSHNYSISYDKEQKKWVKEVGEATYVCGNCYNELNTCEIEDILRQVDEL